MMKPIDITGKHFPNITDKIKDELTFKNITSPGFGKDINLQVGVLKTLACYGYSSIEIRDFVLLLNQCGWKDPDITLQYVRERIGGEGSCYKDRQHVIHRASAIHPKLFSDALFTSSLDYLSYFLRYYGLPKEDIPPVPLEAVFYHIGMGRIVLPRYKNTKQPYLNHRPYRDGLRLKWKNGGVDYSKLIMRPQDVYSCWDWSAGLCLIVPTDWRDDVYLDIDMKSSKHPDGLDPALIPQLDAMLAGFHYERTPGVGYHVFGKGRPQEPPILTEMHLVSTLIVTYPTSGYTII